MNAPIMLHGTLVPPGGGAEISVATWIRLTDDGLVETIGPCFCRPPLPSGPQWHEHGWHHMIGCPMRPEGTYTP